MQWGRWLVMDIHSLAHKYTPAEQWLSLRQNYKGVKGALGMTGFSCHLTVRPTPISSEYVLKVVFEQKSIASFSVYVDCPKPLKLAVGKDKLPHVYDGKKQKLCLYHPKKKEWNSTMLLSRTAIPWAVEWLYFYEIWLCTGEWLGGGEHPPSKNLEKECVRVRDGNP